MAKKFTVIGNWKMHGSKQQVAEYVAAIKAAKNNIDTAHCEMVVCPPAIFIPQFAKLNEEIPALKLGAQDVSEFASGAYTGQIAASMLLEHGCQYVIIGHSERRQLCQETDEQIADKFFAAKAAGLIPILCVGETQQQREAQQTARVVTQQLKAVLSRQGAQSFLDAFIAYEPIWAIGTGLTATPEQAQEVHHLLKQTVAEYDPLVVPQLSILYGGSVKAANARALFAMPDIDGALVGGASLQAHEFLGIVAATVPEDIKEGFV